MARERYECEECGAMGSNRSLYIKCDDCGRLVCGYCAEINVSGEYVCSSCGLEHVDQSRIAEMLREIIRSSQKPKVWH